MFGFGIWEVVLVLALVLLFFGGKKFPELARGLGSAIRNFKGELGDGGEGKEEARRELEEPRRADPPRDDEGDELRP